MYKKLNKICILINLIKDVNNYLRGMHAYDI